jgi:hypothetical protein
MNKLQIATNGHPFTNDDLEHLQGAINEISWALGRLCSIDNNPVIIDGLKQTQTGINWSFTSGWAYNNNEIFYVRPINNVFNEEFDGGVFRILSYYPNTNPYLGKYIHNIRHLQFVGASSVGQPVAGDVPSGILFASRAEKNIIEKANTTPLASYQPVNLSTSTNNLAPKLGPGYTANCSYIKDGRRVQFQGFINEQQDEISGGGAPVISLPAGFRSTKPLRFLLSASVNGTLTPVLAYVDPATNTIILEGDYGNTYSAQIIDLSPISYIADN